MEPSFPFDTLVNCADAEDITNEIFHAIDLPLDFNNVTSNLASWKLSAETMIKILNCLFLHKHLIRIIGVNINFLKAVIFVINPIILFQNASANNAIIKKENEFSSFDQHYLWNHLIFILKHTKIILTQMNNLHPTL